ncbi:hypothetical protein L2E82_36042 [Cichorium intybus]|uniref:Uncharacterized protein n=1 Tax=Cichorium intybus TaxID=13427 RepID=A0ACB9BQM1_CICIN|nr:hypothetical protein L2E82_36042 [Cichorium intybus]
MIAHLFHAPIQEHDSAVGVATVGSSEAMMLAGLAFKRKWQAKRKSQGKTCDNPNIVTGSNMQVCWEKFARYFEVELKEVKVKEGYYVMDPAKAVEMVDENTICVAAILGSTMTGEFEDVKLLNDLLMEKNKETGWETPIHVDAASGGFVAPFLYPNLEWDFKLPLVKSINVSGHKYGLVYAGVGWVVWRSKDDLPDELVIHINYLGSDQPTFTLNFSKGSSQIIAQYYQFIRLGFEGYKDVMTNCHKNMMVLKEGLEKTGKFNILSKDVGVPLLAFSLKDTSKYTVFDISKSLRRFGWTVPPYTLPPDATHVSALRAVIREDFSHSLADKLIADIVKVVDELEGERCARDDGTVELGKKTDVSIVKNDVGNQRNTPSSLLSSALYFRLPPLHSRIPLVRRHCSSADGESSSPWNTTQMLQTPTSVSLKSHSPAFIFFPSRLSEVRHRLSAAKTRLWQPPLHPNEAPPVCFFLSIDRRLHHTCPGNKIVSLPSKKERIISSSSPRSQASEAATSIVARDGMPEPALGINFPLSHVLENFPLSHMMECLNPDPVCLELER